jgi:hypothetical protein
MFHDLFYSRLRKQTNQTIASNKRTEMQYAICLFSFFSLKMLKK